MKLRYTIGAIIGLACLVLSFWLLSTGGVQYADIATAADLKKRVSVKGKWLRERETKYDSQNNQFSFVLQDDSLKTIPVVFAGAKPNNFELAESVVVKGTLVNGVFQASDILTKCPSKYEGSTNLNEQNHKP